MKIKVRNWKRGEWTFGEYDFWEIVDYVELMHMDKNINFDYKDKFCISLLILLEQFEKLKEKDRLLEAENKAYKKILKELKKKGGN